LNPNFGQLSYIQWEGNSNYNSLQLRVDKRLGHGLDFQGSYTYSKAIDDADGSGGQFANQAGGANLQNAYDTHADRARAQFDLRHNLALSATYQFPRANNLKGFASTLVNGWEANAILTAHSGYPFTVYIGFDRANQGSLGAVSERPDLAPGRSASSAVTGNPSHYIDATAFVLQPVNTLGNAGRDILTGPGLVTFDLGLFKNTHVFTERLNIQFRAEIFNLFNRTNFANPLDTSVFSSAAGTVPGDFGQIVSTTTPSRQIQFGLKFIF
jgi:hypothetical protein